MHWLDSLKLIGSLLIGMVMGMEASDNGKRKGWKASFYPDIRGVYVEKCGKHLPGPEDVVYKPYICDPDALLNKTEAALLNRRLHQLARGTPCHCQRRSQCNMDDRNGKSFNLGFVVAIALVKELRMTFSNPQPAQIQEFAAVFGNATLSRWALGDCGNSAIIVLWEEYNKVYIATGRLTKKYLTADENADILKDVQDLLQKGAYNDALRNIIEKIHHELRGEPEQPVDIGTLSLIIAVAVAVFLVCIITGCVCAFRCCGNLLPESRQSPQKTQTILAKKDSFKPDIFGRGSQLPRGISQSPKVPHVPRNPGGNKQSTQVMLRYMRDHDTTMV